MNNLFLNYFLLFVDVRSLFEDYKNIELKIKNEQLTLNETGIDLRFVNRKQELLNAWETYAANIDYKDVKQTLLVSGQMYGSGKTVFGKQLFNFNNPYIKSVFENEFKTYSSSAKDILSNTLPVYIDVGDFIDKFDSMYHFICGSIFVSTLNQYFQIDTKRAIKFCQNNESSISNIFSLLLGITGRTLFLHFDEVSILPYKFPKINETDTFNQFWLSIISVQHRGCFVYVSGKSLVLNFFGRYGSNRALHLTLPLFKVEDIKQIFFDSSKDENQTKITAIGNGLKITNEEEAQYVAECLYEFTTGVPRIVEYSLDEMIKQTKVENCLIDWRKHKDTTINKLLLEKNLFPDFTSVEDINGEAEQRKKEIEVLVFLSLTRAELFFYNYIDRRGRTINILLWILY